MFRCLSLHSRKAPSQPHHNPITMRGPRILNVRAERKHFVYVSVAERALCNDPDAPFLFGYFFRLVLTTAVNTMNFEAASTTPVLSADF